MLTGDHEIKAKEIAKEVRGDIIKQYGEVQGDIDNEIAAKAIRYWSEGIRHKHGQFADCALALLRQLNKVDLPTFGKPTIPHFIYKVQSLRFKVQSFSEPII